ncbi:uncharacterized protein LOC114468821 [Gouania willdenowi]|uniref:uncharacterized protein LOC114468821 n=1 Tax=Gouania willdenowi TaxID=441366 RepID=UPI001054B039|nr:uncharacterized protein LOC114468821 [Gouania willdenowi]
MTCLLWLSPLLIHVYMIGAIREEVKCISQPSRQNWKKVGQTTVLSCTVNHHCRTAGLHYDWFVFKENAHLRINQSSDKYRLDGASLHIKSLHTNDSGVYHCAAAPPRASGCCTQYVGQGETLTVRDVKIMVRYILVVLSMVLLAIYSIGILTLFILKKCGCRASFCRKMPKSPENRKTSFSKVLEEMDRKRNRKENNDRQSENCSEVEATHDGLENFNDDVYQNI